MLKFTIILILILAIVTVNIPFNVFADNDNINGWAFYYTMFEPF